MDVVDAVVQHKRAARPPGLPGPRQAATSCAPRCAAAAPPAPSAKTTSRPAQVAAVLDAVDVDVLDRTELILTVFSSHARSLEGTLQVHLAQLQYELTRVRGQGQILSRLGAGTDMRGPGEQKLEVDRRVIRQRIQTLRGRIERMARTRRTQRAPPRARRPAADRPGRLHQRRQVDAAERAHRRRRRGPRPPLRDARPDHALVPLPRPRLPDHRHGRLHPQAAAPAGRRLRLDARGDAHGRPAAHRRRRQPSPPTRSPRTRRRSPTCSPRSARATCRACSS